MASESALYCSALITPVEKANAAPVNAVGVLASSGSYSSLSAVRPSRSALEYA